MEEASQNKPAGTEKKKGGMGPIVAIIAILAILGIGLAVMGSKNKEANEAKPSNGDSTITEETSEQSTLQNTVASATPQAEVNGAETATAQTGEAQVINVEAGSFYYKPDTITVKKGQKVKVVMKSVDMMHDFNIDELGVKVPIAKSGETATAEFTADKVGTFEYYCSVGKHRANGQVGKITVTE